MLKSFYNYKQHAQAPDERLRINCRRIRELLISGELNDQNRDPENRQFFLIENGNGNALIDNEEFKVFSGTLVVIPANCLYQLKLKPGSDGFMFSGSELFLRTQVAQTLFTTPASFWESYYKPNTYDNFVGQQYAKKRKQVISEISRAVRRFGLGCDAAVMAYIFVLLTEDTIPNLLSGMASVPKFDPSSINILYQYQTMIEKHFREHLAIEDYCRMLSMSQIKLIDTCKQFSGFTPLELVHKRLILEAKRDLLNSSKTINEITFELGFSDSAYFSRFFKKQTGISPTHFRKLGC